MSAGTKTIYTFITDGGAQFSAEDPEDCIAWAIHEVPEQNVVTITVDEQDA